MDQRSDIIPEAIKGALVGGAGGFAVEPHLGVRHAAVENDLHGAAFPGGGNGEAVFIKTLLVATDRILIEAIVVFSKDLSG